MKKIYKYELLLKQFQDLKLPLNPNVQPLLSVQWQHGRLMLWAEVETDDDADLIAVSFRLYGTGEPLDENHRSYRFINTVQCGSFVWHVYEIPPNSRGRIHRSDDKDIEVNVSTS